MDPAQILELAYKAGFDLQTFDRFPRAIGLTKGNCIALLEASEAGLRLIGRPGWRMGEALGVLTTKDSRQVFQAKGEIVEATPERLRELRQFEVELTKLLEVKQ
jgi:hypothetical protein